MIMADVLMVLFIILGVLIVFVSYWLLSEALFPVLVDRTRGQYRDRPLRTVLLGALIAAPFFLLAVVLLQAPNPVAKFGGAVVLLSMILLGLIGSAGLTLHIGERLPSPSDGDQPWRSVLRGGVVLSLTFVLPFIGWFMILPVTLTSGFGVALMTLLRRKKDSPPPPEKTEGVAA